MLSRRSFQSAPYGRLFLPEFDDPKLPVKQVADLLNDPKFIGAMTFASEYKKKLPVAALGEIIEVLERIKEIEIYFNSLSPSDSERSEEHTSELQSPY